MGPSEIEKMKREKNSITKQMMQLQHKKVDATQVASKKKLSLAQGSVHSLSLNVTQRREILIFVSVFMI